MVKRRLPNILVAGTPASGKSSLCEAVAVRPVSLPCVSSAETDFNECLQSTTELKHINFGAIAKERGYHAGKDEQFDSLLLDETSMDKICDELEEPMARGGVLLEHHSCDYFPERWFDLVLVLTCDNSVLYDRLTARGYTAAKVSENVEAEIMRVIAEEAHESYPAGMVHELASSTTADMDGNAARIEAWLGQWLKDHPQGVEARPPPGERAQEGAGASSGL